jgi:hypothetical protein
VIAEEPWPFHKRERALNICQIQRFSSQLRTVQVKTVLFSLPLSLLEIRETRNKQTKIDIYRERECDLMGMCA